MYHREEPTTIMLLSWYSIKLTPNHLSLYDRLMHLSVLIREYFICSRWHRDPQLARVQKIRDARMLSLEWTSLLDSSFQGIGITGEEGTETV